jgi:putative transposase
LWLS